MRAVITMKTSCYNPTYFHVITCCIDCFWRGWSNKGLQSSDFFLVSIRTSIRLSLSMSASIRLSICPSEYHSNIHPSIRPSIHASSHQSDCLHPSIHPAIHPPISLSPPIHSPARPSSVCDSAIHPFIHSSCLRPSIRPSQCLICASNFPSFHPSLCLILPSTYLWTHHIYLSIHVASKNWLPTYKYVPFDFIFRVCGWCRDFHLCGAVFSCV